MSYNRRELFKALAKLTITTALPVTVIGGAATATYSYAKGGRGSYDTWVQFRNAKEEILFAAPIHLRYVYPNLWYPEPTSVIAPQSSNGQLCTRICVPMPPVLSEWAPPGKAMDVACDASAFPFDMSAGDVSVHWHTKPCFEFAA